MNSGNHVPKSTSKLAVGILAILSTAAAAQETADWDLPAQSLASSLRAVAARTDSNIIFDSKTVGDQPARPLKKQASADEALQHLLEGTGLTYRHLDNKTIAIRPVAPGEKNSSSSGAANDNTAAAPIRLAQAGPAAEQTQQRRSDAAAPRSVMELEEIVVTGTQIRGIRNNTVPIIVLSEDVIQATGYSTTSRLLESLPQNFALTNQSVVSVVPGVADWRTQGASINLRGISEGTTLVLVNGRRMAPGFRSTAVDISALPLSAIKQVEILTDGASALYGSDAVGGVVNFILRDDFEGAQTQVRGGWADGGIQEYRANQALGSAWDSGNMLLSMEYYKRDLLPASARDFVPSASIIGSLAPRDESYSAVFTGRQNVTDSVSFFADGLYTNRDSYNYGGRTTLGEDTNVDNPQLTATVGLDWTVGTDWQIELSGSYARNELTQQQNGHSLTGVRNDNIFESQFAIRGAELKADGTLFTLPGGNVRMAIGGDWRSETYEDQQRRVPSGLVALRTDSEQTVRSAFGEVYVPIVGEGNAVTGIHSLELSLAGRYDEYSNFGSSFDPQVGLMWEPVSGLRLRGSHGTSYKAPNLADYNLSSNLTAAVFSIDPGAVGGVSYQLQVAGIDVAQLVPQESESSSFGLELVPASLPGLQVAANYYRIEYTDRIANPPVPTVMLGNPAAFGSLVIRDPSAQQVNDLIAAGQLGQGFLAFNADFSPNTTFSPDSIDVIVDARRRNLSVVNTSGVDLATQYDFKLGEGRFYVGLAGTYILELEQQVTPSSVPFDSVDTIYNPPHWRLRGSSGWQRGGWAASLWVNHTDAYTDNRSPVTVPVDAYTTVDVRMAYDFTNRFSSGLLSGLTVAMNVQNLLDEDPPHTVLRIDRRDSGFDPTNANPLGRFVALEISKSW